MLELPNPLGIYTLTELINKLVEIVSIIAVPVVTAMVLWGAFQIIISAGNSEQVKKGGRTIMWAAVGFAIVLLANGISAIIESLVQ